ncbi:ureidoglycolate lyase [Bradyrhizobium sp. SYSU BS000235]|uniref:ureidoglycolate lyase n=1 Tax=Bradyrhizobium sp. SYSU BS000235 TaxID=3411332 RepID=UPI003C75046F
MSMSPSVTSRIIRAEPLTAAGFAAFGTVLEAGDQAGRLVNQGRARRLEGVRAFSHEQGTAPVVDLYQVDRSELPFKVNCFERHPLSDQLFTPMDCARYLVIVAPDDANGQPDLSHVSAFVAESTQGICYRIGTWHAPMIALDAPALMTMLMWETKDSRDCEEFWLDPGADLFVEA